MNRWKLALAGASLAAFVGLGAVASAQAPGQGQGRRGQGQRGARQISLATMPVDLLEKQLKLTAEQKTKVTTIHDKYAADIKPLAPQPGQQVDPANRQKMNELRTSANQEIEAVLTEEQKKKLADLRGELTVLTAAGAPAGMIGELKWTDDQKKKIADINKERDEKMKGLAGATPEERRTKSREITQETRTKIQALLTDDQKAQIEKYRKDHPNANRGRRP